MNSYLGHLPVFDHKTSEWLIHKGKLTQFLKINGVDDEKKSGILLTHLTEESYRLVLNLAFPKELEALSYKDLVELLDGHFKPKKCSFVDKAKFFGASRKSGETLGEWAARLRGLATYCDFGTALETNLRDRFVLGLSAGPERDKLFEQSPSTLTLARAIEVAEQAACAKEAKAMFTTSNEAVSVKEEPVYRARFQGQSSRGRSAGGVEASARRDTDRCSVCGMKNHSSDKCRYKGYKCQKCGVKGHLKKVCGGSKGSSCVYHVDTNEECSGNQDTVCEECQNFNIRFDEKESISGVQQLKSSVQKGIRSRLLELYPHLENYIDQVLPKKDTFRIVKCHDHIEIMVNSAGELLFFRQREGPWMPTLKLLHKYPFFLPMQQVDKGAIRFVLSGANIMCPGLTSPGARMTGVDKGQVVAVMAEGKEHALAVGCTALSTDDIAKVNKGVGIENCHYLNDGLWQMKPVK